MAFRVIDSIDEQGLERLREAVSLARARAWQLGARPCRRESPKRHRERAVIDIDATLTGAHSDKELAAGTFKGGYGDYPPSSLSMRPRRHRPGYQAGNAGSNTAKDHIAVLDLALEQLDTEALAGEIRSGDGAGATHELTVYCSEAGMRFSFGFDVDERVRQAILSIQSPLG